MPSEHAPTLPPAQQRSKLIWLVGFLIIFAGIAGASWWAKDMWKEEPSGLGACQVSFKQLPMDADGALKNCQLAAKQGYVEAQLNLGVMYGEGRGVAKNDIEAEKWYRLVAEQRVADAQYNLGVMYAKGRGIEKNDAEALRWVKSAAKLGQKEAQAFLRDFEE
jgi:TPR repeat protein